MLTGFVMSAFADDPPFLSAIVDDVLVIFRLFCTGTMTTYGHFATNAIHAGQEPEQWANHEVIPPICLSTTFKQSAPAKFKVNDSLHQ
ncbi:unnamed protein product [Soboliphyme baturini]|uniref:Secreted protein n=1 Tax=Soboliphyme baturini TaxID=241478 RepID=A0A183JB80_9BILA|nr:unnamed protein product [Soboliphyme baturini]